MMKNEIKMQFIEAVKALDIAQTEMHRPKEDVVMLSTCMSINEATGKILNTYLSHLTGKPENEEDFNLLVSKISDLDKDFFSLNFIRPVLCEKIIEECKDNYCLDFEKMQECYATAQSLIVYISNKNNVILKH
jgi:hypothetical protein